MGIVDEIRARVKVDDNGCWIWQGRTDRDGYGLYWRDAKRYRVHRVMCESVHGKLPQNILACHECDVPQCCNPAHLWPGTNKDNIRDAANKGRLPHGSGHARSVWDEATVIDAVRRVASGESQAAIERELGVSTGALQSVLNRKTWRHLDLPAVKLPGKGVKGAKHYLAKLTEDDVREIRRLRSQGESTASVARKFNVCSANVTNIIKRKSWAHVE